MDNRMRKDIAYYHLPGLFEFYELYRVFLPLFHEHREYFGSITNFVGFPIPLVALSAHIE